MKSLTHYGDPAFHRPGVSFIFTRERENYTSNLKQTKRNQNTLARTQTKRLYTDRANSYCRQISVITKLNEEKKRDIKVSKFKRDKRQRKNCYKNNNHTNYNGSCNKNLRRAISAGES